MPNNSNGRLHFDEITKARLYQLLSSAFKKKNSYNYNPDSEICLMISCFECFAEAIPESEKFLPEKQQRRQERINSLAAHIEGLINQIEALDSPALGYAIHRGCEEISNIRKIANPFQYSFDAILEAEFLRDKNNIKELKAFSLGLRKAAKDLPVHVGNTSGNNYPWYSQKSETAVALALEKSFFEAGIDFTTSNNGLAAECLRAIYDLGGLKIDRVDYWLGKAKNHRDSLFSISKRCRNIDQGNNS
ncbi:MAG TPA: hypothetical protein PKD88_08345 [Nitrosomonas sp.]|nr:hypothetical protein [Nitrosomonas sp.]HMY00926.1 hypothetical protein [Agitococcus sp.]HMW21004.1 hypothetical protein [Nitrosomonas sp.]HMY62166.1 hypothetical protein [Nitrosomonas sp.]HMY91192.1 hypothetical protein [Nitrosomonas sp.]